MSGDGIAVKLGKGVLFALALLFLAFLFLQIASRDIWIILLPFHLICGWFIHGSKALPHLFGKWQEAVLPLGCLLMAAVIAHRFVRRWVDEKFPARTWRIRHTAGALSLLLLGSAAAIAASGVVHQTFWLAGGKVIESNRRADLVMAYNNGRQLMYVLMDYHEEKGRYPRSFDELMTEAGEDSETIRKLWWLNSRDRKVPEPWVILRPGEAEIGSENVPVIISPVISGYGEMVVFCRDFSFVRIRADELADVTKQAEEREEGR